MKKADFIKALENYPDDADILVTHMVDDGDGGYSCTVDAEISYYNDSANAVIISACDY